MLNNSHKCHNYHKAKLVANLEDSFLTLVVAVLGLLLTTGQSLTPPSPRSPVLKAAFVHNMVEKATGKINIDGIESK